MPIGPAGQRGEEVRAEAPGDPRVTPRPQIPSGPHILQEAILARFNHGGVRALADSPLALSAAA